MILEVFIKVLILSSVTESNVQKLTLLSVFSVRKMVEESIYNLLPTVAHPESKNDRYVSVFHENVKDELKQKKSISKTMVSGNWKGVNEFFYH